MKLCILPCALVLVLAACASSPPTETAPASTNAPSLRENVGTATVSAVEQTREGFSDAALSPLEDLNVRREEIPPLLVGVTSPYDLPQDLTCLDVERLLAQLDTVLGPDWDTPNPDERLRTEKLADSAAGATLGVVASEARGLIPFRGLVRKATGAESHENRYNKAFKIGAQRRAYLKGYGLAKGCPLPARPDFSVIPSTDILFKGDAPEAAATPALHPSETTLSKPSQPTIESEGLQTVPREY